MKKITALLLALSLCLLMGCTREAPPEATLPTEPPDDAPAQIIPPTQPTEPADAKAKIRILDTDLTRQSVWQALSNEYTSLTGVPMTLLTSEAAPLSLGEDYTPTIFTIATESDPVFWADYCMNLSGQPICSQLLSTDFALRYSDKVLGIAYRTDFFGLVYNTALLARAGYTRADIGSFDALVAAAGDITANRDILGFAAFACPDLSNTGADGFPSLLGSLPTGLREFWDLYTENAACSRQDIAARTTTGGLDELLRGEAVFYLAGAEDYEKFRSLQDHELDMLPIYSGSSNQSVQGLCAIDTSYWCIHAYAPEADQQAALAFLNWLVTPRADGTVPVDDFGDLAPYRQAQFTGNPLEAAARAELLEGKQAVVCSRFAGAVDVLAQALATYAGDPTDENWAAVTQALAG